MSEMQIVLDEIRALRGDVKANTDATQSVVTANAVLTERVGNLIDRVNEHIDEDEELHGDHTKKIAALDKWKTELKTKIATYAAVAGVFIAVAWDIGKEALARIFP